MISYDGLIEYVESLAHTSHDCPWEGDFYSRVLRRSDNKKWFGLIIKAPKSFFLRYGVAGRGNRAQFKMSARFAVVFAGKVPRMGVAFISYEQNALDFGSNCIGYAGR